MMDWSISFVHCRSRSRRCWGEPWTVQREGVNVRFFSGDGIVKNVPENKAAVFEVCCTHVLWLIENLPSTCDHQIVLENTSESNEAGDYVLQLQEDTNTNGLKVFIGGQSLSSSVVFNNFPFGGTKVVVEVFRGPNIYDYISKPITLVWGSVCDDSISDRVQLKPQYLKPCAKVEFHSTNVTFAITPSS